jgi:hypothetical protein
MLTFVLLLLLAYYSVPEREAYFWSEKLNFTNFAQQLIKLYTSL